MAKITTVTLLDDIDGTEADETIQFAVDGKTYEIDLSKENAAEFRHAFAGYIESARRVRGGSVKPAAQTPRSSQDREFNKAVREWAHIQGIQIGAKGRIPAGVLNAYKAGH